jgi:dihydrodipicolinate synthase/N-acetylneuraminate lyase
VLYLYEQASIATPIPLWVYNNPATTRHVFSINELATIATFDNVVGFKDRAANAAEIKHRIEHINNALPAEKATTFNWGFSGETKGSLVLGHGGNTWHSALAGVLPSICVELAQAAVAGRSDRDIAVFADHMQSALNPLTVIMTQYGGIRVTHTISQLTCRSHFAHCRQPSKAWCNLRCNPLNGPCAHCRSRSKSVESLQCRTLSWSPIRPPYATWNVIRRPLPQGVPHLHLRRLLQR